MPQKSYTPRLIDAELAELVSLVPAVVIEGPRATGKTTTARRLAKSVFNLDDGDTFAAVLADPRLLVNGSGPVLPEPILIDEWQRFPESWDLVRRAVDENHSPGRFILTGSSSPANPPTHTGAGRINNIRMRPMSLAERWVDVHKPTVSLAVLLGRKPTASSPKIFGITEVVLDDYLNEIISGGFPVIRDGSPRAIRRDIQTYCDRIVDAEFEMSGHSVRNPAALRRWMRAYAAATSTTASYETIRDAATSNMGEQPARNTVVPYNDTLESMWVVEPLSAWLPSNNQISRLGQASKHHLADPALAASLLRTNVGELKTGKQIGPPQLRDRRFAGRLFESLMALNLRVYAQAAEAEVFHLRDRNGEHEIDFIVERGDGAVVAIEVKFARVPDERDFKHLLWLKKKIGDELIDAVMVTTGSRAYRRSDGIAVVPAALLGP